MSERDPMLTDKELEIESQAEMEAAFETVRNPIRPESIRVFASKAELRRYNANRRNW